jgi:hypothetical protein
MLIFLSAEQGSQVSYENVDMGHISSLISEGFLKVILKNCFFPLFATVFSCT